MDQDTLELDDLFEKHRVSSYTVTSALNVEHEVCTRLGILRTPPTAPQARGPASTHPHGRIRTPRRHVRFFASAVIDLTQGWSDTVTVQFALADLLAMVACVNVNVKLHIAPGQLYPHALPQLLDAFGARLARVPHAAPALHEEQVVHQAFILQRQLGYELAILTHSAWIEICRLRCAPTTVTAQGTLHQQG